MVRFIGFNQQLVFISVMIFLALGRSFSHARRQVKEAKMVIVTDVDQELAADRDRDFNFEKVTPRGTVPNVEKFGRKLKQGMSGSEVRVTADSIGFNNRKRINGGEGEEDWQRYFMAFSADYRSPAPHPPRHN